jgi:tRNA nucleotidyltransferase (CCA-adding enzyme)
MRAGEVYVTPEDSVATLRQVMTEHDWGQVPVLDPRTGELLGIVTRTDLIKQWSAPSPLRPEMLDALMAEALPGSLLELLREAGDAASGLGYPLYAVGGFVRDLSLGEPNFDVDMVVEGDAIRLTQALAGKLGGHVRSHRRFGTAKWILPEGLLPAGAANGNRAGNSGRAYPDALDFVTARTEFYEHPTALPTVERSSIKQDLHRRDFTINTLAVCLIPDRWGELLDFYGGRDDLESGVIRALHSLSFVEDPTRILRAVRFEQRFGFRIEPRTEELIADALDLLDRVSAERVRHELELILAEAEPERAFARLAELGVLSRLHSELKCDAWLAGKAAELRSTLALAANPESQSPAAMALVPAAAPRLYLALLAYRLPAGAAAEFLDRYRIRREYRDLVLEVHALSAHLDSLAGNDVRPSDIVRALDESSDEARLLLRVVSDNWLVRQRLDLYQRRLRHVRSILDGDDLRRLGVVPGRIYRQILERLRSARLDGEVATRAEEEALVRTVQVEAAAEEQDL